MPCKTCKHAIFDRLWGDYKCSKTQMYVIGSQYRDKCEAYERGTPVNSKELDRKHLKEN